MSPMNRREFLTRSAAVGATLGVAGGLALPDLSSAGTGNVLWGANCLPKAGQRSQQQAVQDMEQRLGRRFGAAHYRMTWNVPLVNDFTRWSVSSGHVPLLSWFTRRRGGGMVSWASIARGEQDAWIHTQALNLKATGWRGYLAFHKEPENEGNASDWKSAFNHVHNIFNNVGVPGFKWLVTLTAATYGGSNGGPGAWMPAQWDILGVDGYNRNFCGRSNGWRTFDQVFGTARDYARSRSRRLYIQEWGCVESTTGRKAQWIDNAHSVVKSWPEIIGLSYNHENTDCNYWIDSSTSSFNSFKNMGQDPYF